VKTVPERREVVAFLGVGIAASVAGWLLSSHGISKPEETRDLRSARFTDLEGKSRSLAEWEGRVRVVNFWATWCAPCREEIPALVITRDKLLASGVEFIGIAIDQASKVAEFVRTVRISYPVFVGGAASLDLVRTLGNPTGGLPFTVVLDRMGGIANRNLGIVTQHKIEQQVRAVLSA